MIAFIVSYPLSIIAQRGIRLLLVVCAGKNCAKFFAIMLEAWCTFCKNTLRRCYSNEKICSDGAGDVV